jgi:hypothetical protein
MMPSPECLLRVSLFGVVTVVSLYFAVTEAPAASSQSSPFCKTSDQKCRVSSWLSTREKQTPPTPVPEKQTLFQETTANTVSSTACSSPNPNCSITSPAQDSATESLNRASGAGAKPRDTEVLIEPVSPIDPRVSEESRLAPAEVAPTAPVTTMPKPSVKPLGMSGPPAYNTETGDLNVNRLKEQSTSGPVTYFTPDAPARYRLASLSNGLNVLNDGPSTPDLGAKKSTRLERLNWTDVPRLTIGTRVWFSQGKLGYNFAATGGPNVASELLWQGQNVPIFEIKADLVVRRFVSTITLGYGSIDKGTLRDQDFELNSRTGIFSDTLSSPTDGYVLYGSLDIGPRVLQWRYKEGTGAVDLLFGFQYWREKWTAKGVQVILCNAAVITCALPTGGATNADAITETVTWHILRLGPRFTVPVYPRVTLVGHAFYIPWTYYENEDIHHLRTDVSHDPSFLDKASGGEGIQLEAALQVRVWKALRLEGGWRYWDLRSGSGDSLTFVPCTIVGGGQSNCGIAADNLNAAKARRQGIFFGLDWTF